jgi:8-hydroxy-5-deazaflavin:NADPH oxidoreductase
MCFWGQLRKENMRVGIFGSGDVAKSFGRAFLKEGHEVMLGSREPEKLAAWVQENGQSSSSGTFSETAKFGEFLVIAVNGAKAVEALQIAEAANFSGKVVIDATNPLDMSDGIPPKLIGGLGSSSGELIQKALPNALVVKAFNSVGNAHFYKPQFTGGPPDMFICGNDAKAKELVERICKDFGWNSIHVGGIEFSHYLEAAAMIWIITAFAGGHWNQAFKLMRK